ncbi:unnamed protein product [Pocillopora meandrina]|uniref:EGF-like domain-containing protein n=1 Tax=Pocillopora meandrina TaxID=46732 RepID=A0AAU9WQF6_9CNID|nr:unnamed protein product [Pocillopora meandrina]
MQEKSCIDDVTCANGCCKNNPCLNGGTCSEVCEPTGIRYSCSCGAAYGGRHCQNSLQNFQDHKAAGSNSSGLYTPAISGDAPIGRPTLSNEHTSLGSEIIRLTGELLADTRQVVPCKQIA